MRAPLGLVALALLAAASAALAAPRARQISILRVPPVVQPALGPGARVFPVYGSVYPSATFGAGRADAPGAWHHGDDLFAPLGTPVLACADGVVFSVGWNRVGGWRLWLVDREGNEFYYAHLSAYSSFGVDGAIVHAGDVLGFVGDSGDAEGTPDHLHFEVHPVSLLPLGYDGAVDPDPYLRAWRRVETIPRRAAAGWRPHENDPGREAGAVLLGASDISNANGLDRSSLARLGAAAG
ncbi:MAG TPA: M23 family metallopeptidase [Gaiellaceae bacterium]|nr:M23 family metallopeptidase [Gaiellaceae bacterium]